MAEENEEIRKIEPGSYRLFEVMLTNGDGEQIDILGIVSELKVVESIYSLFATYTFTIVDSVALLEKYIITGNEKIKLTLAKKNSTDEDDELVVKYLVMSGIGAYSKTKNEQQVYQFNCISETAMKASLKRVSRSVAGNVAQICGDLYEEVAYQSPLERIDEGAEGNYKMVLPNRTYVDTIKRLLSKCQTTTGNLFYMFETLWHDQKLTSYAEIVARPAYETYKESFGEPNRRGTEENYEHNRTKIIDISSQLGVSHYQSFKNGAFISKIYDVDIATKSVNTVFFDITADGGSLPSLELDYTLNPAYTIGDEPYSNFVDATHYVVNRNSLAFNPEGAEHNLNEKNAISIAKRRSVLDNQNAITHSVTLNADTNLRAGERIDLKILPSIMAEASGNNHQDDLLSGKYYIATVTHTFALRGRYAMKVNVKRDTFTKSALIDKYAGLDE
jgi:hypothetical protein